MANAIIWLRRAVSTILMMSVFFIAFVGGLSLFLSSDFLRGALALGYVVIGLFLSRILWA